MLEVGRWNRETISHGRERRLQGAQLSDGGVSAPCRNVGGEGQHLRLLDRVRCAFPEDGAEFEEAGTALVLAGVEGEGLEEAGQQAPTERVAALGHGVLDLDQRRRRNGHGDLERAVRTDEAAGDGLVELPSGEHLACDLVGVPALV